MQIIKGSDSCPDALKGASLAIGNFDGVHRGHQVVLEAAMAAGRAAGSQAGVLTFEPHPRDFFQPAKPVFRLTPEALKLQLFGAMGLDLAVTQTFDSALSGRTAVEFVAEILVGDLGVSHVVTGSDFKFGKGRDGDAAVLRQLGDTHGFGVTIVEPQGEGEGTFSSSRIREHLRIGETATAAEELGYWWRVRGTVVGGDRRGRLIGFPTANIDVPRGFGLQHGIYAVRIHTRDGRFDGASYLGTRPSFDDGAPSIETFLFGFSGDLYGQEIELEVIRFLRPDEKFESADALVKQMTVDCEASRDVLAGLDTQDPIARFPMARALN
ncbi:MAG: bifunctional riboflavin kinase/FAD synthetase [Hyphomicrobiaceae bacterium]|nr:bifunctional riboflavin kinase/FAD synthetase [Hyphomicrobiaceae bacterium]